jgi:zinc D-Ala-D-Ala carboxypeptidase
MSRRLVERQPRAGRRRHRWWPAAAIALVCLVVVAIGPGGGAQAAAGAIERVLGNSAFEGPLPACTIGDRAAPNATLDDWDRTLLDTEYALDRDYAPTDLVAVTESGVRGAGSVRAFVVLDLQALGYAARKAGLELSVESAYRSYDEQRRTFDSLAEAYGRAFALESAARPGHSEHQLGTTLDFAGHDAWLARNAWRFGFVLSYPEDSSPARTCYKPESWHYRYFGRERAAAIHSSGLSPREWLWEHADEEG